MERDDPSTESWSGTPPTVVVTDQDVEPGAGEVVLRPRSLVVGVGSSSGADPEALHRLATETLGGGGACR